MPKRYRPSTSVDAAGRAQLRRVLDSFLEYPGVECCPLVVPLLARSPAPVRIAFSEVKATHALRHRRRNEAPVQESNITNGMRVLLQESGGLRYSPQELYPEYYSMENANGGANIILTARKRSDGSHDDHLKEHGGQIYQVTKLENAWIVDEDGKGKLGTKLETLIGTDENRLFIEANSEKSESNDPKCAVSALYSRNVAPFWDVQAGVRYSEDKNNRNSNRIDGVIGLLGLAPYFFETQAYLYGGENNFWGASFELERDLLLTQKLITQPYIDADVS